MAKGDRFYYKALSLAEQDSYDSREVVKLLEDAVVKGNKKAAYALASWYLNGFHVRKNYKKAFALLQLAVQGERENGFDSYKDALYDIAVCYELGQGVGKDAKLAFYYYLLSAFNGDMQAIEEVSRCLCYGIGCTKNNDLSQKIDEYLLIIAKEKGNLS